MKATIVIEVPDEFVRTRLASIMDDMRADMAADPSYRPDLSQTPEEFFVEKLEGVCNDELLYAMWGWPIETTVQGP